MRAHAGGLMINKHLQKYIYLKFLGDLLLKLWTGQDSLIQEEREMNMKERAKMQEAFEESYNRIHRMYRDIILEKERLLQEADTHVKEMNNTVKELKNENKRQQEKESIINKKLSQLKQALLYLNRRVKALNQENEAWKSAKEPQFLKLKAQQGGSSRNLLLKTPSEDRKSLRKSNLGQKPYIDERRESLDSLSSVHSEEEEDDDILIDEAEKDELKVADLNKVNFLNYL